MSDLAPANESSEDEYGSPTYAWYVVTILLFAYVTSFLDRTILTLLVEPIRESLGISDLQLSLLHGFAFAIFYVSLGVPIARYADSHNRVRLISVGVLVWSLMTAVCGLAKNFTHMFLARVGVGIGEATLSPAAYSIISDYFPVEKRPRAYSIYQTGIYIGMGLAMIIGGYVIAVVPSIEMPFYGHMEPWQVVFLLVGLPGILIFLLLRTIREPARKGMMVSAEGSTVVSFREVLAFIGARRGAYGYVIGGVAAKSLAFYGVAAWLPTYFMRNFGWDAQTIGLWYGLASIIFGVIGINTGSTVSMWIRNRGYTDANLRICLGAEACLIPIGISASLMPTPELSMMLYCGFIFFASFSVGCQAAALQEITPNQMRAQVSAIYLFVTNMIGIGFGPTFIAFFTDMIFKNDASVGYSMSIAVAFACPIGVFLFWRGLKPYRACLALAGKNYAAPS
ncbi:MAG: MFS family permease [Porticoccaceae bacterium]|jgi:MFS family permease|tara:strand:- start:1752 stop:3107 length:1356 start_codon:yes stop_codon:yes gene_type:complete